MDKSLISDLPAEEVEKVVNTWVEVAKIPTLTGGHLTEDDNFINILTTWNVNDAAMKEGVSVQRNFSVLKTSLRDEGKETGLIRREQLVMTETLPSRIEGKGICYTKDGRKKAMLVEKAGKGGSSSPGEDKQQFIQIWNEQTLEKSYDLGELDKHKNVYTHAQFGAALVWSPLGDKLAYLAERKSPKLKSFFSGNAKKKDDDNGNKADNASPSSEPPSRGEEYAFKQTWGEQLPNMYSSVVVIVDVEKNDFTIIDLGKDQFPSNIQWVDANSIIGSSYKINPDWKLGLIFCTNRECRIFKVNVDGTDLKYLSGESKAALSPRVRPDGKFVIWQERALDIPHNRARSIFGLKLDDENAQPKCLYEPTYPNIIIYDDFPRQCWSNDGKQFFVIATIDGISSLVSQTLNDNDGIESKTLSSISSGVDGVLWIGNNYLLLAKSSITTAPHVELLEIAGNNRRVEIMEPRSVVSDSSVKLTTSKIFGKASIPSFFVSPDTNSSLPFIVWTHGGPNSHFVDRFTSCGAYFLRLGFCFVQINYIGSTGANKRDETDDLVGKVGSLDVEDCQNIVKESLKKFTCIDSKRVGVYGGSHGGFLTCHLISQFPDAYHAAVALNPVCDFNVMLGITDIPDWVCGQGGIPLERGFLPGLQSIEEAKKLFKASPISRVSNVKAPTLMLLGTEDLRVPMSQGYSFYRALKTYGKTTEVRMYPDNHSLMTVPVWLDSSVHMALWFKRFLK